MLEELAISIIFGIIGHSSGIATEKGVHKLINFVRNNKEKKFINHDLKRGLYHAYLLALMNLCNECLTRMKESRDENKDEISWLESKQRQLSSDLQSNEKENANGELELSIKELGTLLSSYELSDSEYVESVKKKLIEFTLQDKGAPHCFEEKIKSSFFDELALYFAFEIKNNDRLRYIFENQILSQIDLHVDTLEQSIYEISKKYPELQKKLDTIQTELITTRTHLDSHHQEIIGVLTGSVNDISEIKTHLKILTQYLEKDITDPAIGSDSNAILFIKKDDIPTNKKIALKTDKKIFVVGRKTKNFNPDIPLSSSFVSKGHAFIENIHDGYTLIDKSSKNGTRINGIPLEKGKTYRLNHGDQISLANDNVICYFCWRNDSIETLELPQ